MIGLILSYLTSLKFWVGLVVGAAIGWAALKRLVLQGYAAVEKKL